MTRLNTPPEPADTGVEAAACDWFARQRSGDMSAREARDLEGWLALDPAHREAFDGLARAWAGLEGFRSAPEILRRRERAKDRYAGLSRIFILRAAAVFAGVAVIGAGALWSIAGPGLSGGRFSNQEYRTAVGERTNLTLPDGSVVTLNTGTVLRTRADRDRRVLYLDQGQAFFRVAKDARRPFVVHAAGRTVTAVGTAFDVRVDGRRFEVTLVEGKVRVAAPAPARPAEPGRPAGPPVVQTTELVAGNRFVAPDASHWVVAQADAARQTGWLTGRLTFADQPLGEVAAEISRYSERKIVIDDPTLAAELVSGTFEAGDVEAFLRTLRMANIAVGQPAEGGAVRLAAL